MYRLATLTFSTLAALSLAGTAQAQDADPNAAVLQALEDAIPGTLLHNPLDIQWTPGGNDMRSKVVPAAELTSGEAIQVRLKKRQDKAWKSHIVADIPSAINKGDKVQVLYWVRTAKAPKGADAAEMVMFLGRNNEPYDAVLIHEFNPGTAWEMKQVTGTADADFPAGETKLEYQLGRAAQTVEFGPVYVSRLD